MSTEHRPAVPAEGARAWIAVVVAVLARAFLVFSATLAAIAVVPVAFGLSAHLVTSESMRPLISAGDVVLAVAVAEDDPAPLGGVVVFTRTGADGEPVQVLHRLVADHLDGTFATAGDANPNLDAQPLAREDIERVGVILVPWVGLPVQWLRTGELLPFAGWLLLTLGAIAAEAVGVARRGAHADRRGRTGARATAGAAAGGLLLAVVTVPTAASVPTVEAAFTAQTVSVGSSWRMAPPTPADRLVFLPQPGDSTGGVPLSQQPAVQIQDANGRPVTGTRTVALSLVATDGAVLQCDADRVTTTTGIAGFSGCVVDRAGTYTLKADSGPLTVRSAPFTIAVGPPARLVFSAVPGTTLAGTIFEQQPVVDILDAGGNLTTTYLPISLTPSANATLNCNANPQVAYAGRATFERCQIDHAGTYTLTATSGDLQPAVSAPIVITQPQTALRCNSSIWYATFSWSPTPYAPTTYRLYVDGVQVPATGADGWNSYVQLSSGNVPAWQFPEGTADVRVVEVLVDGSEELIGTGTVVLGPAGYRTYFCG